MDNRFNHTNYIIRRKFFVFFGAKLHIFAPSGELLFFSKLKAFKLREDIRLFTGEDMGEFRGEELLTIHARNIIDFSAVYDVFDPETNEKVGALKRKGFKSLIKDEWIVLDKDDTEIGIIKEDKIFWALLRRVMGEFLINLIPQTYDVVINGETVCKYKQNFNPFIMKLYVDFSDDKMNIFDRRLGIAAGVLFCCIEGKQQ